MIIIKSDESIVTVRGGKMPSLPLSVSVFRSLDNLHEIPLNFEALHSTNDILLLSVNTSDLPNGQYNMIIKDVNGIFSEFIFTLYSDDKIIEYEHNYRRDEYRKSK